VIQAFVADLQGDASLRDQHLDLAHPAFADEHVPLARNWPELRAFLDRHPLDVVPVAPSARLPAAQIRRR